MSVKPPSPARDGTAVCIACDRLVIGSGPLCRVCRDCELADYWEERARALDDQEGSE